MKKPKPTVTLRIEGTDLIIIRHGEHVSYRLSLKGLAKMWGAVSDEDVVEIVAEPVVKAKKRATKRHNVKGSP